MKRAFLVGLLLLVAHAGCGNDDSGSPTGGSGATDGGTAGTGGSGDSGTGCFSDCDDGFNCTIDSCVAGKCTHAIGPTTGETACPIGQYCTVEQGCIAAPACADVSDCEKVFGDDACKANIRCDPASSVCLFDILDKDQDNHPPQVCGGADCNDDDPLIHPGAVETCDGEDQDCDGTVDNEPIASSWCESTEGAIYLCKNGACDCKPENDCSMGCVDITVNSHNCGSCGHSCPYLATCEQGACKCPVGTEQCGGACMYTGSDPLNCGGCDKACPPGATCDGGSCACPSGLVACGQECVDTTSDAKNCGSCGNECPAPSGSDASCVAGKCSSCPTGYGDCDGNPVNGCETNLQVDTSDCGACGHSCSGYDSCYNAVCSPPVSCFDPCGTGTCPDWDPQNCGTCGHVCASGEECVGGTCWPPCTSGLWRCGTACVDLFTDPQHCGSCVYACAPGYVCNAMSCGLQ